MRPQTLDEIVGQEDLLGPGKLLRRAIETNRLSSIILWGSAGCGKTTLASVIAQVTKRPFARLNAVTEGLPELRKLIKKAEDEQNLYNRQTILFIDEVHRFNKAQQDGLLPSVENGTIVLIGATTQNPYFSINRALLSRSLIFQLQPLSKADIVGLCRRALSDPVRGLGQYHVDITDDALDHFANYSQGDARMALNALELAVLSSPADENGTIHIDLAVAEESIQRPAVSYDGTGDEHYDIISAFIKSMRGSDPDAALYYLARMLDAGEDPLFIARRIVILSCEDVGMADPQALVVAQSAADALQFVGMPEGRIILAQAVVYMATAPKSNCAYMGVERALADVRHGKIGAVPKHLRDAHYKGAQELGHGIGYKYPHDFPMHQVEQQYLPDGMTDVRYYFEDDTVAARRKGADHE
ncbi:MAG: replication-associated recombination protein A [Peptococcaceae bacterium]|nr:replication-associated recombination protein A [Peptococcaceae bacterium]